MVLEHLVLRGTFTSGENKMTIDINKLRRLAQAATPGPWIAAGPSFGESLPKYLNEVVVDREGDEDDGYSICNTPIGLELSSDMAFIAAANPATLTELLDRLEAAERERDECNRRRLEAADHFAAQTELMKQKYDDLRAKIEAMERQEPVWFIDERGEPKRYHKSKADYCKYGGLDLLYALPGAKGDEE